MTGCTEKGRVGSEVCVEIDLVSSKKEERKIRFIVNGKIQNCVIVGVGNEIRYGVWNNNNPIILFTYISVICHYYILLLIVFIRLHFLRILKLDLLDI